MYKLKTSAKDTNDLSIGFHRDRGVRQRDLTNYKNIKRKYHVGFFLKDAFGFAEHQVKATFGLVYKLTITRNGDNADLNKDNAINNGKTKTTAMNGIYRKIHPVFNTTNYIS